MKSSTFLTLLLLLTSVAQAATTPAPKPPTTAPAKPKVVPNPQPKAKPAPVAPPSAPPVVAPSPAPEPPVVSAPAEAPVVAAPPVAEPPVAPPAPAPPVVAGPKTWALLVGVSKYESAQISSLNFPAKDASGLLEALTDADVGGLARDQVLLLTDAEATRENIKNGVSEFLKKKVQKGDKIIVFLAGHGVAKGTGLTARSFLLPTDAKGLTTQALENSAVDLRALADELGTLPASQFVVFVDACREDPTPGRGLKGNPLSDVFSRGMQIVPQDTASESATFFACSVGQRAYEDSKFGHGVFTNWILQGLREGAVSQLPDSAVDMGRLSSYVAKQVGDWAANASATGDFEYAQTPELVATQLSSPLVLLRLKRPPSPTPFAPTAPRLLVSAFPEGAQISINGKRAGTGTVEQSVQDEGDYKIDITQPGYAPISRSVKALGGYQNQIVVQMEPAPGAGASSTPAADDPAAKFYARGVEAEGRSQWEVAEQGYKAAIGANPKFFAAYEELGELHRLQNRNADVIADALGLLTNAPRGAHSLSVLSQAYSRFARSGAGTDNAATTVVAVNRYGLPRNVNDAVQLAQRAAAEALAIDPSSPEANRAQGYALAALDVKSKNKRAALDAFAKAAFLDESDATNHVGLGYGLRFYAVQPKNEANMGGEVERAVVSLKQAIKLRPNYYEAHRELAYCYVLLNDTNAAIREGNLANANRGAASDAEEIAGLDMTMSGMHQKAAETATGNAKLAHQRESEGYMVEAGETSKNKQIMMQVLNAAGISTALASYVPAELRPLMDIRGTVENKVREKMGGAFGGLLKR